MPKVTLDMNTFKALASDTRLDILRALDGKKMSLKDIEKATRLNKATLHEHLQKLNEAGLVKRKEREGHKWVYYKLTWKGEGLLHPENTRIVVMFSITFVSLLLAVMLLVSFSQPIIVGMAQNCGDVTNIYEAESEGIPLFQRSYNYKFVKSVVNEEQSVDEIKYEVQTNSNAKNVIGQTVAIHDIKLDSSQVECDSVVCVEFLANARSNEEYNFSYIQKCLNLTYWDNVTSETYGNESGGNETIAPNDNETNGNESDDMIGMIPPATFDDYPPITEMIFAAEDKVLLYLGIACLTFFGVLFSFSSWRFWKNRIPRL